LRIFSFGGYGLSLAALALVVSGAIECPPFGNCDLKLNLVSLAHKDFIWKKIVLTSLNGFFL